MKLHVAAAIVLATSTSTNGQNVDKIDPSSNPVSSHFDI